MRTAVFAAIRGYEFTAGGNVAAEFVWTQLLHFRFVPLWMHVSQKMNEPNQKPLLHSGNCRYRFVFFSCFTLAKTQESETFWFLKPKTSLFNSKAVTWTILHLEQFLLHVHKLWTDLESDLQSSLPQERPRPPK